MPQHVDWSASAERELRRLDHQTRERIHLAIQRFAETGHGDVKALRGRQDEWRLRVGAWRILFTFTDHPERDTLFILRVLPRDKAYRD